ncbi:MAG: hypothetical protein Q8K75_00425 [Chlamydiales bacterium]|nr:hypothetical protein [Chlamydiales bacterium]
MVFFPQGPAATFYNFGPKIESMPKRFVNWIAARDNQQLNTRERCVQWISQKLTGNDPYARSGFERGCTIAKRVGIVFGSGLAVAGGLYAFGKTFECLGTDLADSYRNRVPTVLSKAPDGKDLCEHRVTMTIGRTIRSETRTVDCEVVKRAYAANVSAGEGMAAFGKSMQSGAGLVFGAVTMPFYTAYALPKKLFSMMPTELPWIGNLPVVNLEQKVSDLFAITKSTSESLFGKL